MLCLSVHYVFPAEHVDEAIGHLRALAAGSSEEPGCLLWTAHRAQGDANAFFIYEQYVDAAALDAHRNSSHFATHGEGGLHPLAQSRTALEGTPLPA